MRLSRFVAGGRSFCIDRFSLRGVVEQPVLAPTPGAPAWLVGAYNHLGRAVAAVDVGALTGLTAPNRAPQCLLLIECGGHLIALAADSAPEDHPSQSFSRRGDGVLEVVDKRGDLLWIDLARLHDTIEVVMLGAAGV